MTQQCTTHLLQIDPQTNALTRGYGGYDFGTITSVDDTLQKSITTVPIVTLPTDCTFALESGTAQTYTFRFSRVSPVVDENGDYDADDQDSSTWSNARWIRGVTSLVNRWQARTGGYKMNFNTIEPVNPRYPTLRNVNIYVRDITINAAGGFTDHITGSISVVVGGLLNQGGE